MFVHRAACVALCVTVLLAVLAEGGAWTYQQQGRDWTGTCKTGKKQSPINVSPAGLALNAKVKVPLNYGSVAGLNMKRSGHMLEVNDKAAGHVVHNGHKYHVKKLIFHSPSENSINGVNADAEMQIVHQKEGSTGENDLLYMGVLFRLGGTNEFLDEMGFQQGPTAVNAEHVIGKNLDLRLNNLAGWLYHWEGSTTQPPCSETVSWFLRAQPAQLSSSQLNYLHNVFKHDGYNTRATQPLHHRTVTLVEATVLPSALVSPYAGQAATHSSSAPAAVTVSSNPIVSADSYELSFNLPLAYMNIKRGLVSKATRSVLCHQVHKHHPTFTCSRIHVDALYPARASLKNGVVSFKERVRVRNGAVIVKLLVKSIKADSVHIGKRITRHQRAARMKRYLARLRRYRRRHHKHGHTHTHHHHHHKHHSKKYRHAEKKVRKANGRVLKRLYKSDKKHLKHAAKRTKKALGQLKSKTHRIAKKILKLKSHIAGASSHTKKQALKNKLAVLKARKKKMQHKAKALKKHAVHLKHRQSSLEQGKLDAMASQAKAKVRRIKKALSHAHSAKTKSHLKKRLHKAEGAAKVASKKAWQHKKVVLKAQKKAVKHLKKKRWQAKEHKLNHLAATVKKLQHHH